MPHSWAARRHEHADRVLPYTDVFASGRLRLANVAQDLWPSSHRRSFDPRPCANAGLWRLVGLAPKRHICALVRHEFGRAPSGWASVGRLLVD